MRLEELEAEALKLPEGERAELASRLIASIGGPAQGSPEEIEAAWLDEADRRLKQYEAGEVRSIPAEEVFRRLREKLG